MFASYVSPAPSDASDFVDPLEAMISFDDELYYLPEYYYWDYETPTSVGCPYGGTLQIEASETGDSLTLEECAFSQGFMLTGSGSYDYGAGLFTLDVTVSGIGDGVLGYVRDDNQSTYTLTGDFNGEPINLSE
jgi:hypothetical protein